MQDGPIKATVKLAARLRYLADLKMTRWIKSFSGEPFFRIEGACNRCGQCCQTPVIPVHPILFYLPIFKRMVIGWHRLVNGFDLIREERRAGLLVFECSHWNRVSRRCDSYNSRPGMCRDYPGNLVYAADPELFDTCGYRIVLKNAARMARALEEAGLAPETLQELKANLHIIQGTDENTRQSKR